MIKNKIICILCDIFILLFLILFILFLLYFLYGSLEMNPTEEQQDKVRMFTLFMMFLSGFPCLFCIRIRRKYKKQAS